VKPVQFESLAYSEFIAWSADNPIIFAKIVELIKDIDRSPFKGKGKPEPLKYDLSGWWSRHINKEHRLVYKLENEIIIIASCKGHYL
jgi:toxin YoeB